MYTNFSKYSNALVALLKEVFTGDVVLKPVDDAFQYAIKQTADNLKFPFISVYPDSAITVDQRNNTMPSYTTGTLFENALSIYNDDGTFKGKNDRLAKNTQTLYIYLGYQLDVWGIKRIDTEEVMQELLFWLYQNQEVQIEYADTPMNLTFELGGEIVDNSDLVSYTSSGKLYRYTYTIRLHAVLLRSTNHFTVLKPNIKIEELKD